MEPEAQGRTSRGKASVLWAALVFVCALPVLYFRSLHLREWEDEGYFANGGLRVLGGEIIYRDFQHNYPPGRSGAIAFLTLVFGHHLAVVRTLWVVLQASAAALGFLVARRMMPLGFALLAGAAIVMNTAWMNKSSELFLSASILLVLVRVYEGRLPDLAAGALLALCGHLRHDVAVFGMFVFPVAVWLRAWSRTEPGASGPLASVARGVLRMLLGAALATLPFVFYLLLNGALRVAWRDLLFSGFIANKLLPRPFPPFTMNGPGVVFWIPVVTYALGLLLGVRRLSNPATRATGACVVLVTLYGIAVFMQVLPRSDMGHLNKAYVPVHIIGMFLVYAGWSAFLRSVVAQRFVSATACLVGALLVTYMPFVHLKRLGVELPNSTPALLMQQHRFVDVELPRGTLRLMRGPASKYQPLFDVMKPYAGREGEWLVVYPAGALLNFVFDIPNPLRYDLLRPGEMAGQHLEGELIGNHPLVLQEIHARLEETRPRFLMDSSENTNDEVRALFREFATANGYRELVGGRFRLWVRPE
jgi:hypothetical protein